MLFIYQICTQQLLCTMYTALTKSFPNINLSNQVNLSKKALDGSYCYYPHLTEEEIKDREMRSLPSVTQLVSDPSGFEPRQCGSRPCFELLQPRHLLFS